MTRLCISEPWINISTVLFFIGVRYCSAQALHTEYYHPISEWELEELNKANLSLYPNDIRPDVSDYFDSLVAWPGIIKKDSFYKLEDRVELELLIEHRYYDWLEDYGMQRERIFLSPRGEGSFRTTWTLNPEVNIEEFKKNTEIGSMVMVYGYPDSVLEDSVVYLKSTYIRPFPRRYFRCDLIDYGRPGPFEKKFTINRQFDFRRDCCLNGCLGIGTLATTASLSFLGFGDEVLGVYWACGSLVGFSSLFQRRSFIGPAFSIPMMLGCAGLSYYNFAYGDRDPKLKVFLVNALGPVGIGGVMLISAVIFRSAAIKMSNSLKFEIQPNGVKLSNRF